MQVESRIPALSPSSRLKQPGVERTLSNRNRVNVEDYRTRAFPNFVIDNVFKLQEIIISAVLWEIQLEVWRTSGVPQGVLPFQEALCFLIILYKYFHSKGHNLSLKFIHTRKYKYSTMHICIPVSIEQNKNPISMAFQVKSLGPKIS